MKKIAAILAGALLAASVPVSAGSDDIPIPPETDWKWEFYNTMCALTGLDLYCDWIEQHPKPDTDPAPNPGG